MIMITGVHGVGKSYFCKQIIDTLHIKTYTASELIAKEKQISFGSDKLIRGETISDNQQYLLLAVNKLKSESQQFILDGHFCLLNSYGKVERIPAETFIALAPDGIIVLTEKPQIIVERRKSRDGVNVSINSIEEFQNEEIIYATEVAKIISAKLFISRGKEDRSKAIDFIKSMEVC